MAWHVIVQNEDVMQGLLVLQCELLHREAHLIPVNHLPILQAISRVFLQQSQILHDGVHMPCDDLVKITVLHSVDLKVLCHLKALGLGLFGHFLHVEDSETLCRVDCLMRVRGVHLEHGYDDVVPPGRSEEHVAQRHLVYVFNCFLMVQVYPIRVPDVSRPAHPIFQFLLLHLHIVVCTAELYLQPIFALDRDEIGRVLFEQRELLQPYVGVGIHTELAYEHVP
mmetsp:Transcript_49826/g.132232  ORF Transcript_49826/g.132232 Transcript_49826/m.132232 type:complete len:224 (+) Transcript_49826:1070-1741(+)